MLLVFCYRVTMYLSAAFLVVSANTANAIRRNICNILYQNHSRATGVAATEYVSTKSSLSLHILFKQSSFNVNKLITENMFQCITLFKLVL